MSVSTARGTTDGRSLVSEELFSRLTARVASDHRELAADMPIRIVDQALAFLGACAVSTEPIGPSDLVDIGWHTFILYTREYAEFCDRVAGRFIHHQPDDAPGDGWPNTPESDGVPISSAVKAIRAAGFRLDADLWNVSATSDCTQCHAGCHDSPGR
ncbi:glycine-rich domain-containing protein [Krasilnikovia sp. MM14-A1259]|uniref:glycine-rich domain-containing protein n=1 Tax=Krasilnikovia sp. MM14-A1259 TaxID=3373539 RepID=UPI0037FA9D15